MLSQLMPPMVIAPIAQLRIDGRRELAEDIRDALHDCHLDMGSAARAMGLTETQWSRQMQALQFADRPDRVDPVRLLLLEPDFQRAFAVRRLERYGVPKRVLMWMRLGKERVHDDVA